MKINKLLNINCKNKIKKYKNNNYIPGVIYNKNLNFPFYISLSEINKLINKKKYIIYLTINNNKKKHICLIKDIQYNVFRNKILHIDLYKINVNKPFIAFINIKIIGNSIGVSKGGICNNPLKKIKIKTLLKYYPKYFKIDITNLDIGDKIYIKDILENNKNIKFLHPINQIIVSIKMLKITKEDVK
ncbi:50S ribosomal protein L25 [Candidatus Shikimatogenerans bostrichidophilus]|uniref:50S ribosomal protein L25 n=1 Tax=Candidatus Shikimatogenerans bostrichidophilus TaxID=2943807 RepID=UPI0029667F86